MEAVVDLSEMDIPEAMIETQQRQMVDEFAQRITMQGLSMEQYFQFTGTNYQQMIENVKPQAEKRIQSRLVLELAFFILFRFLYFLLFQILFYILFVLSKRIKLGYGVAFEGGKGENYPLTIGSGAFIPGFEEQLVGAEIGKEVEVNVTFPEDYQSEDLKGKAAVFKCTVKEIKEKELPELDDEFAGEVSEFDTLAEYKEDVKKNLEEKKVSG